VNIHRGVGRLRLIPATDARGCTTINTELLRLIYITVLGKNLGGSPAKVLDDHLYMQRHIGE
jgi:hypothetical protein